MELRRTVRTSVILALAVLLTDLHATRACSAQERLWQDLSGLYKVKASLVTSDEKLVVLKKSNGELVLLKREQLSPEDREYVSKHPEAPATKPNATRAVVDAPHATDSTQTPEPTADPTVVVTDVILPAVVSRIDDRPIVTLQELEKHLAKGGGGANRGRCGFQMGRAIRGSR